MVHAYSVFFPKKIYSRKGCIYLIILHLRACSSESYKPGSTYTDKIGKRIPSRDQKQDHWYKEGLMEDDPDRNRQNE